MNNAVLYLLTVVIWGTTWIGIKYQLGTVDIMVSVAHRSLLAGLLVFVWVAVRRQWQPLSRRDHGFLALQGLCLFAVNYVFIYTATGMLATGLVALVFSTIIIMNAVNMAVFLKTRIEPSILLGSAVGLVGIVAVYWPQLDNGGLRAGAAALLLCAIGTLSASFGNVIAARNRLHGLPVLLCNAWGMTWGAVVLYTVALLRGVPITVDWEPAYLISLAYLVVFGSAVAFWAYVTLIGNIGTARASYANLLYPVVALLISTVVEGFVWQPVAVLGLALVLLGNWLVMRQIAR